MDVTKRYNAYHKAFMLAKGKQRAKKRQAIAKELHRLEKIIWQRYLQDTGQGQAKTNKLFVPVYVPRPMYKDVILHGLVTDSYELTVNADIYGTDCPLPTDRLHIEYSPVMESKQANVLIRDKDKGQDRQGTLPHGVYIDSTNYFNIELKETKTGKHKRKKRYRTIVRKDKDGKYSQKRYKIEEQDYKFLTGGVTRNVNVKAVARKKDVTYLSASEYSQITQYLESITLPQLYNEKIRNHVTCVACGSKATLTSYENKLACGKCWFSVYNIRTYRIKLFYVNSFERYELNELTGTVRKQIETSNGFRTIYKGNVAP